MGANRVGEERVNEVGDRASDGDVIGKGRIEHARPQANSFKEGGDDPSLNAQRKKRNARLLALIVGVVLVIGSVSGFFQANSWSDSCAECATDLLQYASAVQNVTSTNRELI